MNYRRRRTPEQVIVPYPFLNEGAELRVENRASTYIELPDTGGDLNQWYRVVNARNITIPAGCIGVIVRPTETTQLLIWDSAPADAAQVRACQVGDYVIVLESQLAAIYIAGFIAFQIGDQSGAITSPSFIRFPSNLQFVFRAAE